MRRTTTTLSVTVLAAAALLSGACSPPSAVNVATETASRGSISQAIEATGSIAASNEAKVSFQQSGVISVVRVKIGDAVKKGDVLAELDATDLTLAMNQAEAQLEQSKNNVRNAEQAIIIAQANYSRTVQGSSEADIKAAEAAVASANANYTRVTKGQASDAAAAKAAVDAAQANLDKLKAGPTSEDIAAVAAQLQNAEAALRSAQFAYDNAFRSNPAGIGASPASAQLETATNNYNLAKSNYDKAAKGADAAQIRAAEQQLASARANLARYYGATDAANRSSAQQQIESAQASLDRLKQPARDFDIAQGAAQIEQARIALDNANAAVRLNEIAIAQAKRRFDQAVLRAPFDGVIGSVNVREGESASVTSTPNGAFVIAGDDAFHMDVTVDELDVAALQVGQDVEIAVDALPAATVTGKVDRVSSTGSKINGVVNYNVRVALNAGGVGLKSGMSATARIVSERKDNVVLVPSRAIRFDSASGKSFVGLRNGNEIQEVEVKTGLRDGANIEVTDGLSEGSVVVLR
jgi:HlyD family secretion protein